MVREPKLNKKYAILFVSVPKHRNAHCMASAFAVNSQKYQLFAETVIHSIWQHASIEESCDQNTCRQKHCTGLAYGVKRNIRRQRKYGAQYFGTIQWNYSQLKGKVMAAIDINTVANVVYAHNHPDTPVMNNNIQKLNVKTLDKLQINTILMSPPCQPHTRVGQRRDIEDNRSDALNHICELLPQCKSLQYVLMENVKGFEESVARQVYVAALEKSGFFYREFILTPTQMGIPNTRHRYYCIARRTNEFTFSSGKIWTELPAEMSTNSKSKNLISLLEHNCTSAVLLDEKVLKKRVWLLDIVTADACNTMCFTKAYTHYCEGTGSVFCPLQLEEIQGKFLKLKQLEADNKESEIWDLLQSLQLRYFTPREVARLMSFPERFDFPKETTNRQKYRLLGNSINVCVVGELIKLMCT